MPKTKPTVAKMKPPPGAACQEADAQLSTKVYVPCGRPAAVVVKHDRDENLYAMCDMCAFHNVKNRGARCVVEGSPEAGLPFFVMSDAQRADAKHAILSSLPPAAGHNRGPAADVEEDPARGEAVTDAQLKSVADQGMEALAIQDRIAELNASASELAGQLKTLLEMSLPAAMKMVGLTVAPLVNGWQVKLEDICAAYITAANKEAAHAELERVGQGSTIKREYAVSFGRGEAAAAARLEAFLEKGYARAKGRRVEPYAFEKKESVHSGTLGKTVRELIANGTYFDKGLLGVYEGTAAKLVKPKVKPAKGGI